MVIFRWKGERRGIAKKLKREGKTYKQTSKETKQANKSFKDINRER
jgi:hypothetical protein